MVDRGEQQQCRDAERQQHRERPPDPSRPTRARRWSGAPRDSTTGAPRGPRTQRRDPRLSTHSSGSALRNPSAARRGRRSACSFVPGNRRGGVHAAPARAAVLNAVHAGLRTPHASLPLDSRAPTVPLRSFLESRASTPAPPRNRLQITARATQKSAPIFAGVRGDPRARSGSGNLPARGRAVLHRVAPAAEVRAAPDTW